LVVDIRGGRFFEALETHLESLKEAGYDFSIFYFEASDEILLRRFKEARRAHPIDPDLALEAAILRERELLQRIRERADFIINTDETTMKELRQKIEQALEIADSHSMSVQFLSFGFKYGLPKDADFVFDLRYLNNPFYIESLRSLTGNHAEVRDYVMSFDESRTTEREIAALLDTALPLMQREGRKQTVVAFGCTGGQHRSVTFAHRFAERYQPDYKVKVIHREL
ncbi:MAG: RNase adapter RapZ, partial [Bacillota bacterium]|nr:RNase adapter RapZ [Bacillota bacterium]